MSLWGLVDVQTSQSSRQKSNLQATLSCAKWPALMPHSRWIYPQRLSYLTCDLMLRKLPSRCDPYTDFLMLKLSHLQLTCHFLGHFHHSLLSFKWGPQDLDTCLLKLAFHQGAFDMHNLWMLASSRFVGLQRLLFADYFSFSQFCCLVTSDLWHLLRLGYMYFWAEQAYIFFLGYLEGSI